MVLLDSDLTGGGKQTMPDPNWWNAAPGELYGDRADEDDYELEPEDIFIDCPKCGGSGLSAEGWDCWYCEGDGYIEV